MDCRSWLRFRCEHLVGPDQVWHDAVLTVAGDRIVAITSDAAGQHLDAELSGWLVPGFVDIHCHGADGVAFGQPNSAKAVAYHRRCGTTTMLASTLTRPLDVLEQELESLSIAVERGLLAGVHVEGPFLAPQYKGAHDADLLRVPDLDSCQRLITAGRGTIRMITLAPELVGGLAAIRFFTEQGVRVAFGHSAADADLTQQAIDAGVSVATHLFNAMPGFSHRNPGPIPVLLNDDRIFVELINDGHHVSREALRLAIKAAGVDRIILITDAMSATGVADGNFMLGDLPVVVSSGVARIDDGTDHGPLAGSTLTMATAVHHAVNFLGLDIPDVAAMAATNPARAMGLTEVGELKVGNRADACLLTDDGRLQAVLACGHWLTDCRLH